MGLDVLQPHSVLEVYHTAVCVGGSGDNQFVLSVFLLLKILMVTTLMV